MNTPLTERFAPDLPFSQLANLTDEKTWTLEPGSILLRHCDYLAFLDRLGLSRCEDFFTLSEEIVSGHPNRHVSRVVLDDGDSALTVYLKREHHVPLKERLGNWWAGFGWASKSWRESQVLVMLDQTTIRHPQWMAIGETADGRAFLLLRSIDDALPLTECLQRGIDCARQVGSAHAELYRAGFDHPDLYAGHVFVYPVTGATHFIDWQRACRCDWRNSARRWQSLAALRATVPDELADTEWWRACVSASLVGFNPLHEELRDVTARVESLAERLRQRRHIRSKRATVSSSTLFLQDHGRLWLTPAGRRLWPDEVPVAEWLGQQGVLNVNLPDGESGSLTIHRHRPSWWKRRPWSSPERRTVGLLFRLEKLGIESPRVLAIGEYPRPDGTIDAFLLTRLPAGCSPLPSPCPAADRLLRQLDEAGFILPGERRCLAWESAHERPVVFDVAGLQLRSRSWLARFCSPLRVASS